VAAGASIHCVDVVAANVHRLHHTPPGALQRFLPFLSLLQRLLKAL
jgi:hypothetical protein